jgi:Transcriptional regulator, AbiEi antitoxin
VDVEAYDARLADQAGVISRAQLVECGAARHDLARLTRRRELVVVHRGIYVNHTGPLVWVQRAWAAVLACWPAALSHASAMRAAQGPGRGGSMEQAVHVAVDRDRHLVRPSGVILHRTIDLADHVLWNLAPPRVRYEQAVLDVAAEQVTDLTAVEVLTAACGSRRTTAARLLTRLDDRANLPRRKWLIDVLRDVADGSCSVLEHGFLHRIIKAHGLPIPDRQVRSVAEGAVRYRDAQWPHGIVVELDGRLFHGTAEQRDHDFDRDLDAATEGLTSLRLSYGQVFDRPCATAERLAHVLTCAGAQVQPHRCGPDCVLAR